jgi:hypothetical protein
MSPKVIRCLEVIFWITGWSILVLTAASIGTEAYYHFRPVTESFFPKHEFHFLKQVRLLFSSVGQAFFAFLVSSIFKMIFHRAPARSQQTRAFLTLTCIGFAAEGLFGLITWIQIATYMLGQSNAWGPLSVISYLLSLFPSLVSFIYAVTIYVLYEHFSKLVTFESEVI